jgi:cold shock CspA family protein
MEPPEPRFTGVVKSYSSSTGFGFVKCQEEGEYLNKDIFVHRRQIEVSGATVGATVSFTVRENAEGRPQVRRLRVLEESPLPVHSGQTKLSEEANEESYEGVVKSFSAAGGFGFITCEQLHAVFQRDVFLHACQLNGTAVGDAVRFKIDVDPIKGTPKARGLELLTEGDPSEASVPLEVRPELAVECQTAKEHEPCADTGVGAQATASEKRAGVEEKRQVDVDASVQETLSAVSTPCRASGRPEAQRDGPANVGVSVQHAKQGWERYLVAGGKDFWWFCHSGGEWFLEASPGKWAKYFDPNSKNYYWWKDETTWFWV